MDWWRWLIAEIIFGVTYLRAGFAGSVTTHATFKIKHRAEKTHN